MKNLKNIALGLVMALGLVVGAHAAVGGIAFDQAPKKTNDMEALQNGAKLFANYCMNCHSAGYMRYNRLTDIGLTEQQIKDNLMFATDRVGNTMKVAMDPAQAKEWFGKNPPDLTLMARSRAGPGGPGVDYLYTYLRTYYRDDTKPTGWNNLAYPNVGMPNPFWELQGEREPIFEEQMERGQMVQVFKGWNTVKEGKLSPLEFDQAMGDLAGYMQWMAEPGQNDRVRIGVWVMIFLMFFTFIAWRLNAAYWKDIK